MIVRGNHPRDNDCLRESPWGPTFVRKSGKKVESETSVEFGMKKGLPERPNFEKNQGNKFPSSFVKMGLSERPRFFLKKDTEK